MWFGELMVFEMLVFPHHHTDRRQSVYQSDELTPFVRTCVEKFEKLEQVSLAKTLETFLKM